MNHAKTVITLVSYNGKPASGKDTLGERFELEDPVAFCISPGKILRDIKKSKSIYRKFFRFDPKQLRQDLKEGKLVDGEILGEGMITIAKDAVLRGKRGIHFAGWPREEQSYALYNKLIANLREEGYDVKSLFFGLEINDEIASHRFAERIAETLAKKDRVREDDTPEGRIRRNRVYEEKTLPFILRHAAETGLMFIDATGTKDEIYHTVYRHISGEDPRTPEGTPSYMRK